MKLDRLRVLRPEEVAEEDYLPATEQDRRALAAELEDAGRELENEHLSELFEAMVSDEDFWEAFCEAPAAKGMHHARIGGLLEHSVNCLRIARSLAEIYPVDRDLLALRRHLPRRRQGARALLGARAASPTRPRAASSATWSSASASSPRT